MHPYTLKGVMQTPSGCPHHQGCHTIRVAKGTRASAAVCAFARNIARAACPCKTGLKLQQQAGRPRGILFALNKLAKTLGCMATRRLRPATDGSIIAPLSLTRPAVVAPLPLPRRALVAAAGGQRSHLPACLATARISRHAQRQLHCRRQRRPASISPSMLSAIAASLVL